MAVTDFNHLTGRDPVDLVDAPVTVYPGNETVQRVEHIIDLDAGYLGTNRRSTDEVFDA